MIEVDIFWSFSIGASLAAVAWRQLRNESSAFVNEYFVYAVLFLSCVFAPSGAYLLWAFPGWESMYFLDLQILAAHPMLGTAFTLTNTLNGVFGFYCCWHLIRSNKPASHLTAHTLWITSYVAMFTILGLGYARFLYAGDASDWARGVKFPLTAWFGGDVFITLCVMGIPMLPGLWGPMYYWAGGCTAAEKRELTRHVTFATLRAIAIAATGYLVYVWCIASDSMRVYLGSGGESIVGPFGYYAPLIGLLVANAVFMCVALWPLFVLPTAEADHSNDQPRNSLSLAAASANLKTE